jgi:hypothetical protein
LLSLESLNSDEPGGDAAWALVDAQLWVIIANSMPRATAVTAVISALTIVFRTSSHLPKRSTELSEDVVAASATCRRD